MHIKLIDGDAVAYTAADWMRDTQAESVRRFHEMPVERLAERGIYPVSHLPEPKPQAGRVAVRNAAAHHDGKEWVLGWNTRPLTDGERDELAAAIKAEAGRRIVAIVPEWKQRNLIAEATQLLAKGEPAWTAGDRARWDAGDAIWQRVAAIRKASDAIEALDPIPADFTADKHWP